MGDSKVTRGEIASLAQAVGEDINDANRKIAGLSMAFDCLISVLGKGEEVKAELQRRIEAAQTKPPGPPAEPTPLISVP